MSVESNLRHILTCRLIDDKLDVLLVQGLQQVLDVNIEDTVDHLLRNRRERNNLRQTSQELRTEVTLHHLKELVMSRYDTFAERLEDVVATDIRGEDDE